MAGSGGELGRSAAAVVALREDGGASGVDERNHGEVAVVGGVVGDGGTVDVAGGQGGGVDGG